MRNRLFNLLMFSSVIFILLFSFSSVFAAETNASNNQLTDDIVSNLTKDIADAIANTIKKDANNALDNSTMNATSLRAAENIQFALTAAEKDMNSLIESGFKVVRFND